MSERQDPTPAALYARVSSDRQDVDLSVASQLRALRDYADKNGYLIAREYVDEAQSGRVADRPEFRKMIDEASRPESPFHEILVWKFSRFTRKREHAVAFKSMLRRKGIRVVSITEQAEDTSTGRLLEGIIESVDEFYSENLAQEVLRGMREAASRGFWVASRTPYGYNRVMVQDGPKKRPTLEPDPTTTPILKRIFDMAEAGRGMTDITRTLNDEGIASPAGKLWGKTSVHAVLKNEVYTGALVWGAKAKDNAEPVRVDKAFPGIISKAQFRRVNKLMRSRAPKVSHPRRVGSSYLLSGLVKCKTCNRALSGQDAKSGKFSYYVCQSVMKRGSGACDSPRLNARNFEEQVVGKIRSNILTESSIRALVKVVDEEMDGVASEQRKRLETIDSELADVRRRLDRLYNLVETTELDMADVTPRIRDHRERQGRLESSAQEARAILSQRREVLDDVQTITAYAQDMSEFLNESELTERRAFIESFVKEIVVMPGNALMRYTVPMPDDSSIPGGVAEKVALNGAVLSTVQNGGPVVAHVGTQAGQDSFGVTGAQLVLDVEWYLKAFRDHLPHGVWGDGRLTPVVGPAGSRGGHRPQQLAVRVGPGLCLKLREEPGHAVGVLRLPRPRVDPVAHMPPAALMVCREGCAPDAPCRRELSTVPVGDVANAFSGQRVTSVSTLSSSLE